MQKIEHNALVVVADDLTGAMDSSGCLAGNGIGVTVYPRLKFEITAGVTVINTDSRNDLPETASNKIKEASLHLGDSVVFKKIDSTLRGNIAIEIASMLEAIPFDKVVIAPAFPAMKRTVVNGILLVNGFPVAETDFGRDPLKPVRESSIPALFEHSGFKIGVLKLGDISTGPEHIITQFKTRDERILVCDALEDIHLRNIVDAVARSRQQILLAGSAGLARGIHVLLKGYSPSHRTPDNQHTGPALLVVGSRHPASAAQLLRVQNQLSFELSKLDIGSELSIATIIERAGAVLEKGKSVALTSAFSTLVSGREREVATTLAEAARMLLKTHHVDGLFLSGGDTAMAVCQKLEVKSISVCGEIRPGIPAGETTIGEDKIRLVTKAGGFGSETAIVESMPYLERGIL